MRDIKKIFFELLYPKAMKCCICGSQSREAVCRLCLSAIDFLEGRVCLKCGKGIDDNYNNSICPDCQSGEKHFDLAFSCFQYKDMGKNIIHKLKYEGCKDVSYTLARLMRQKLMEEGITAEAVVPVPMHGSKEATRGFNQAKLIGAEIAAGLDIPIWDCINRVKLTAEQYKLDRIQRALNVHNAFCLNDLYHDGAYKNVLLVDDIYTTGSTVNECSKVLKQHGVRRVFVITAATGSNT